LPAESPETIEETRRFIHESGLDDVDFSLFTPYKKSLIYEQKHKFDIDWDEEHLKYLWYKGKPDSYQSNVRTSAMSGDDLVAARRSLEGEFKKW